MGKRKWFQCFECKKMTSLVIKDGLMVSYPQPGLDTTEFLCNACDEIRDNREYKERMKKRHESGCK